MIRAANVLPAKAWVGPAADTVVLDHDNRHRRRITITAEGGLTFLLDLAEATSLRDGDGLALEDGRVIAVRAAAEPLTAVTAKNTAHLVRLAWHLGNRHLPTQLAGDRLLIRRDHVIEAMLTGLGATVTHVEAPFEPEGGAYGGGHGRGHHHPARGARSDNG
ncbi:MAG: urease accessory protein UreE [Hyphomicrobiales bacterium]|nr:urease accessory protein UreE [Hyphomicrobiales bacterium]